MFDSSLITYAVSLHFSQDINEIISSTMGAIAQKTGNNVMIENKIPPHITIGAFHASKEEETKLLKFVDDFSKKQNAGTVHFTEAGNFNQKVLFLKPEKNVFLTKLNTELHTLLLPDFEKAENGYYLPDIWFPHTTLATRLNQSQFSAAMEIANKISLPLEAPVSEIAVYQCSPFLQLQRFSI